MRLEQLTEKYDAQNQLAQLAAEKRLLAESFSRVTLHKGVLGDKSYTQLEALYADMQALYDMDNEPLAARKPVLYAVYDRYFEALSRLPFLLRYRLKADKDMARLRKLIKKAGPDKGSLAFWKKFLPWGIPCFFVFIFAELRMLDALNGDRPAWQLWIYAPLFLLSFGGYMYYAYRLEGVRRHGDLHSWLRFRAQPDVLDKPAELLQYAKMLLPLAVALGSAMIKLYFQP